MKYLPGTDEGTLVLVNVLLIHFVSEQDEILLVTELQYLSQICFTETLPGRVSRVYNNHCSYLIIPRDTEKSKSQWEVLH